LLAYRGVPASFARTNHIWYPPAVQVIVIDLGNTNSCVAGYAPGKTETMFQFCIPSWVAFSGDGATLVGEAAKNHASAEPDATAFGFKRLLGLRYCARMQIVLVGFYPLHCRLQCRRLLNLFSSI
jgi:hypothetical protein